MKNTSFTNNSSAARRFARYGACGMVIALTTALTACSTNRPTLAGVKPPTDSVAVQNITTLESPGGAITDQQYADALVNIEERRLGLPLSAPGTKLLGQSTAGSSSIEGYAAELVAMENQRLVAQGIYAYSITNGPTGQARVVGTTKQ